MRKYMLDIYTKRVAAESMEQCRNSIIYIALSALLFEKGSSIVYCPPAGQGVQPTWITIQTGTQNQYTPKWITIPQYYTGKIPVSPTTQTTTHRNTMVNCVDKIRNCVDYGDVQYACQGQYASWAKINCARYCGFCCVPAPITTTTQPTTTMPPIPTVRTTIKLKTPTIRTTMPPRPTARTTIKLQTPTIRTTMPPIPSVRTTIKLQTPTIRTTMPPIPTRSTPTITVTLCQDHRDCSLEVVDRLACHDIAIATKCQKTCGICESHTSGHCQDQHPNCKIIAAIVCSETNLRQECRKTCHLC